MKVLELQPEADSVSYLGIAHYRTEEYENAVEILEKAEQMTDVPDWSARFFLAMAHWQVGNKDQARMWYDRTVAWMEENEPDDEDLQRFRAEAAELLGVNDQASNLDPPETEKTPGVPPGDP